MGELWSRTAPRRGRLLCVRIAVTGCVWLALLVACGQAVAAQRSSVPKQTFVTNGPVLAVAVAGSTTYIGGLFNQVGPRTGPGVGIGVTSGKNAGLPQVSGANARVYAVAADGSGGFYIGGSFTHVGSLERLDIAHIRRDGSVDPGFAG